MGFDPFTHTHTERVRESPIEWIEWMSQLHISGRTLFEVTAHSRYILSKHLRKSLKWFYAICTCRDHALKRNVNKRISANKSLANRFVPLTPNIHSFTPNRILNSAQNSLYILFSVSSITRSLRILRKLHALGVDTSIRNFNRVWNLSNWQHSTFNVNFARKIHTRARFTFL